MISKNEIKEKQKLLENIVLENGEITKVEFKEKKEERGLLRLKLRGYGDHFVVHVTLHSQEGSNIKVTVGLPVHDWNGRFLGLGNGGAAGITTENDICRGVALGYATAHTDMGTSQAFDTETVPQYILEDFGYLATHLMTAAGKYIAETFYGQRISHSYFCGGSTGGQQALSEAQRYPRDYDGIVAMYPAFDRTALHIQFTWSFDQVQSVEGTFSKEEIASISDRLVLEYAGVCGAEEGENFLPYPENIKDLDYGIFKDEKAKVKLSDEKIQALKLIYQGPVDPVTGEQIFPGLTVGSEAQDLSLGLMCNKEEFIRALLFPFTWKYGTKMDLLHFDFHKDTIRAREDLPQFLDAVNTDLSEFRACGGKLIILHGTADAAIPYKSSLNYYKKLAEENGGFDKTKEFCRYFLVPGLAHGLGGPGFQDIGALDYANSPKNALYDPIIAMDEWVSKDHAPEKIIARAFKDGSLLGEEVVKEREVYCYPDLR